MVNKKSAVLAATAAGLIVSSAALWVIKSNAVKGKDNEDISLLFSEKRPFGDEKPLFKKTHTAEKTKRALMQEEISEDSPENPQVSSPTPNLNPTPHEDPDDLDSLLEKSIEEFSKANQPATVSPGISVKSATEMKPFVLPQYGLTMKVPVGWKNDEVPTSLTTAMLRFMPEDMSQGNVILLAMEDTTVNNMGHGEFINIMKENSRMTLYMMSNGIEPVLTKDEKVNVGPFVHLLEYSINQAMLNISITSTCYLTIVNNVLYSLQLIGPYNESKRRILTDMAETFTVKPWSYSAGVLKVTLKGISLEVEHSWKWNTVPAEGKALASFDTASLIPQTFVLYRLGDEPEEFQRLLPPQEQEGAQISSSALQDKVKISFGDYVMCTSAAPTLAPLPLTCVINALKSIESNTVNESYATFEREDEYQFKVVPGGVIQSSKLNMGVINYFLKGMPKPNVDDEMMFPLITIKTETDKECQTLEDWKIKLEEMFPEATFSVGEVCSRPCLQTVAKEMVETSVDQKSEFHIQSYLIMVGGKSFFIQWQLPSGEMRKHERSFKNFLQDLYFF